MTATIFDIIGTLLMDGEEIKRKRENILIGIKENIKKFNLEDK